MKKVILLTVLLLALLLASACGKTPEETTPAATTTAATTPAATTTAVTTVPQYTVSFYDETGALLSQSTLASGATPSYTYDKAGNRATEATVENVVKTVKTFFSLQPHNSKW